MIDNLSDKPEHRPADEPDTPQAPPERLNDPVETADGTPSAEKPRRGWAPPRSGPGMTLLFIALIVGGVLVALYAWGLPPFSSAVQTTDNAYVRGKTTVIAPQVNGYIVEVTVQDYAQVRKGQVLARIDDRIYRQRVEQAKANVASQVANLKNSSQSQRSSEAKVDGQEAAMQNAQAQLARARSEEHTSEIQSLMRNSYAVFCLYKKTSK